MRHAADWAGEPLRPERGVRLGGRYELRRRIAVGGMGEVWLSRDLSLDRSVATKLLRVELAGDDRFLERLRAEARASAPLAHPNIAALYDYGEQAGSGYLVMELVQGETLSELLARERTLAPEALLPVLAQTARALHAAHVCGVVHRDVKPSNILLTPDGRVKITDFGISQVGSEAAAATAGTVMGTAQYLAPEQALGRAATPASDIYGLGVVAYEALAGRRPFTGPSVVDIAYAHVNAPVPPLPPSVPEPVRTVVLRMLEKDPERRPRSAASLARTLDRIGAELELARPFDATDRPGLTSGAHAHDDGARVPALFAAPADGRTWGILDDAEPGQAAPPAVDPPAGPAGGRRAPTPDTEPFDVDAFNGNLFAPRRPPRARDDAASPVGPFAPASPASPAAVALTSPAMIPVGPAAAVEAASAVAPSVRVEPGVPAAEAVAEPDEDFFLAWHPTGTTTAVEPPRARAVALAPAQDGGPGTTASATPDVSARRPRRATHRRRRFAPLALAVVVIAAVLLLAAATLAWSAEPSPADGRNLGQTAPSTAGSDDRGHAAPGGLPAHRTWNEVGS